MTAHGRTMTGKTTRSLAVGAAGAAIALLTLGFVFFAVFATRAAIDRREVADGIVVLTGGEARIAEAARLLEQGRAQRLLISGVNRRTSREEVRRLAGLRAELFDCCVDIGYEALDTYGNADEARAWAGQWHFSKLIIVTASYHMPRSLAEIAIAMPEATLVPHAVVPRQLKGEPWWLKLSAARVLVAEYLKFLPVATRLAVSRMIGNREAQVAAANVGDGRPRLAAHW